MKMYASCPICGYKLCKGESGSDVDILCPRCGKLVRVVITETNSKGTSTDDSKEAAKELNCVISPLFETGNFLSLIRMYEKERRKILYYVILSMRC